MNLKKIAFKGLKAIAVASFIAGTAMSVSGCKQKCCTMNCSGEKSCGGDKKCGGEKK